MNLLLDVLWDAGGSYEADLRHFNLPGSLPDRPDSYLPLTPVLSFSRWAAAEAAIEDIGLRAGSRIRLADLEPGLYAALLRAPSLGTALGIFCDMAEQEQSPGRYRIVRGPDEVRICCVPEAFPPSNADNCGEWLRIMSVLTIVRHFAGQDWTPTTIAFQSHCVPGQHARRIFPRTLLVTGKQETSLAFPASLMRLTAIRGHRGQAAARTPHRQSVVPGQAGWDFPASLRAVLRAYLDDGQPSIQFAAEIAGTTVRTLQRRLGQCDLTYSDVLTQVRFDAAKHLLHDRRLKVSDAAYALGYSDPAHFTRAFTRMAGVCPRRYREQQVAA